jgi:serine/threonine protein kinase
MISEQALTKIYLSQLALVLDYLHASGVIYRDLKMENVLVTSKGRFHDQGRTPLIYSMPRRRATPAGRAAGGLDSRPAGG